MALSALTVAPMVWGDAIFARASGLAAAVAAVMLRTGTPPSSRSIAMSFPATVSVCTAARLATRPPLLSATRTAVRLARTRLFSLTMLVAANELITPVTLRW